MTQDPIGREPLRILPKVIEASCFNHVRLALSRLGKPLRLTLPGHRGLDMILDDHLWLVVDCHHGDLPVLVFSGFKSFERGREIRRETRQLPAAFYNKLRLLFARAGRQSLFVPIRTMQYLAIIDAEEIVFVDGQGPRTIELAWQQFRPQEREDLRAPVSYQCVYYEEKGVQARRRLQGEFLKALERLEQKQPRASTKGTITSLERD